MPFCGECGKNYPDDLKFCPHCGAPNALAGAAAQQGAEGTGVGVEDKGDGSGSGDFHTAKRGAAGPYGAVRLEALPEGFVIDTRYEIKSKLGQGGFGAVYLAHDRKMAIDKALKIIPDSVAADEEAMGELHAEARTMVTLNNEHIVRVYDVHDTGTIKYIDMEYVAGKALSKVKLEKPEKKLSEKEVKALGVKIARGMAYAHRNKVIHKDIKPQNIMVTDDGAVKIMDFGISEAVRTSMSRVANSSSSGTLVYMSPEQVKGQDVGRESDIYSFGAMLYELLCGHPPFYKGDIHYQIFNERPADLAGVSSEFNGMIQKCLEKDYRDRYRSFEEVEAVLLGRELPAGSVGAVSPEDAVKARKETVVNEAPVFKPEATVRRTGSEGGGDATRVGADGGSPGVRSAQAAGKKRLPLFIGIGGALAAAVLVMIFVVLPKLGGNDYAGQILELDQTADTLYIELETIVGKALKGGAGEKTIEDLLEALEGKPGNVVILCALGMLERGLGEIEGEYGYLSTLVENEGKGVRIPEVLSRVKERQEEMSDLRAVVKEAEGGRAWEELDGLLTRAAGEELLGAEEISSAAVRMNEGIEAACRGAMGGGDLEGAREALERWNGLAHKDAARIGALTEEVRKALSEQIAGEIEGALRGKDWQRAMELLDIAEGEELLEAGYIAEKRSAAEGLKAAEEQAAADAARRAEADRLAREQAAREQAARDQALINQVRQDMIMVEGGTFQMGSASGGEDDERPAHQVTVSGFYMSRYEVTQGLYQEVMGSNPSYKDKGIGDTYPVNAVSWDDAVKFCNKLSERDGLQPVYTINGDTVSCNWSANGYRLPTEAEWEYAARGGKKSGGYTYAGSNSIGDVAWNDDTSGGRTHPVGQKRPNELGLYDMSGNVWEWCWDWAVIYRSGSQRDSRGAFSGSFRVERGGSWCDVAASCRSSNRDYRAPGARDDTLGFRLVRASVQG